MTAGRIVAAVWYVGVDVFLWTHAWREEFERKHMRDPLSGGTDLRVHQPMYVWQHRAAPRDMQCSRAVQSCL